jgi:hypothetical protein
MAILCVLRPAPTAVALLVLAVTVLVPSASGQDASRPVQRAGLGVSIAEVTADAARGAGLDRPRGALVTAVAPGGAAERAGLKAGDIVLEFDRAEITAWAMLPTVLLQKQPGDSVHLRIWRQRQAVEVDAVLAALAPAAPSPRELAMRECLAAACPACQDMLLLLGQSADKACDACTKEKARDISSCVDAKVPPASGGSVPPPAKPQAGNTDDPGASLSFSVFYVRDVTLEPARVPPGGRFTINVAYTSPSDRPVSFAFTISAGGRNLLASKSEEIAGTSGTRMIYSRALAAASEPGSYVVRVRLSYNQEVQERSATLVVAPK